MFVPSNWACQYLLVFISFKQLLVETRATASDASGEYTAESYINSSSRDLSVTESHQSFVISGVSTTKQLSSTLSTNNFTGSFYSKSSTSYKSITEVIETTATVRNTTTASTNGTSAYGVRDAVSISQAPQIQSTETPRTISRVSSTVGKTNTSITGTAVPVLVSYESNNDTSSNVTAAYSVRITASPAAGAIAKLNISETISNYAMINSSAEHPKPNQTASPHSKIRWTKTVTSSYSAYEGSINSHRNNYTSQVPPSIAPSPQLSTSIAVFQSKNRSMPNISETNFNQSSGMFKENATLSVESIRVTTASDIEHINNSSTISNNSFKRTIFATKASPKGSNSSETFPSYSNIWKTEVSAVNTSLYEEIKSIRASQAAFGTTKIWNVNSTTSVMFPRRVTERNSSGHIEVYSTNVSLNILPRETKTHSGINSISEEEVPSSVLQSPSLVASNLWRVNSTRHFPTVLQASLSDVFETRTNATHGVVASVSYSYSMNETTRVYPTPALATSAPFSEGSIENSTISLLSHKEQTVTRIFSKSSPSLPEEMSDAISNKNTTQVFDVRFSTSLHNSTHTQLNPSFTEEGRTPGEKSQSFWMSSLVKNVSRNTLVFSQTSPEHQTFKSSVSPEITYTSSNIRNLSKPFSSNLLSLSASSLQTSAKHSTYQTSKSLLEVNSSYTTVETNPKTVTDIWPVINSSTPISQSRLSNISSDSMHPTLPNVTLKPSTADVKTSNGLPVLTSPPQINRTTVFPVYTPCYISYVVTVSRRIKQFSPSTDDIKWSRTAVEHQSSRSNDSLPSGTAQLHPTPSTRFSTEFRTTEKHSKKENFPTRSLSRLPDRIESSVQSGHAPTAAMTSTYSTLANETISSGSRNVSYSNAMISNLTVSSLVSNELSANTNFTANIQSHSTPTSNSTQDSSPLLTPARNSSLTPSGKLFSTVNVSRSISKHGKFNLSNETRTVYTAFLSSSQKISSIHINGSTVLRSFVTESLAKNVTYVRYTNGILSTTTYPSFSLKSAFVSIEEISMTTNDTSSLLGHIAQTKTLNSSTLEDESPSTFSSKAVYGTVLQPIKSSHSFFSVSNADQNITTSPDVQAAASTDSIFSTKINQTTTPYHYAGYTSVNYLPSSYSRKSTSQPAVGMTIGGTSTVIGRKTNTSYLGLSTEGQNSVQPTPVLLRTPTINNSSFTLSSPVLGIMYSKEVRSHRSNRSESIFPSVSVLNAIKSSTPSSGGSDESVLDKTSPLSSSLSWKTTRDNSSYFTPNKTDFMTSSLHELSQQNSTIHITINKTATNAAYFTSTKNFDLSSIKPTKVIASIMTDSVAPNLNSALEMTMSSSASLSTTVVLKQSEGGWNAPLRRKRRQVLNANITKPANLSTFYITSPKLEMGESSEGIITPISSLLPTLQAVLSPNFSIRATKVLPRPSLIQTWSTEKVSRAHSRNLSRSRSAEESKSISEDFNSSIIPLPTSSEGAVHSSASLVRPEHTSTILTSGARFVHSSPYSNSSSRRSFGTNSSIHDTSPLRGTVSVNKSSLFNHNSFRTESNYSISATATQKQNMIVTSNYSNTARHSIVLLPSSTKDTVKVVIKPSVSSLLAESNSTSSKVDVINSSSIINTTSQKLITFSNFTITPSITRRKNETRILVSEPRLNISLSTSNGSKISSPEIRNSSYASSMYNSFSFKPTTSTHQQGHNTVFNLPESSLNTIVMKSRSIASTTSKAYEQTLRTMLPLYTVRSANMNISTVDGSAQEKSTFSVSSLSPKSSLEHLSTATKNMKEKHSAITPKNISDHSRLSFTYSTEIPHSPTTGQQQSSRLDINISEDLTSSVDKLLPLRTASHSGLSLQANTSSGSSSLTHIYSKESMNVTETSTANLTSSIEELVSKSIQNLSLKAATYSHTSSVIGNISRASYTVRTAYLPMTTSPSPSFSFIGSKTITATPMLPDRSDTSSHSILNQTFSLPNSHSNLEQTTDVVDSFSSTSSSASHTEQNSTLPTVMESVSSHEGATTGGIDAVGYFTHYIIPTSSLGLCLAGYSTTIFLNVSFHYSATSTIPANLTASSTFASASVELYANVTSTELQYSSVNQTSTVMRPLQRSSVTVNMINISSSNPINSSVASSSLLRSAQSSLNASSRPKVTVFTNVPMKHTILSSVLLNTTITVSSSSIVSQPTSTYAGSSILHSMRSSITDIPKASTVTTTNTSLTSGKIQVSPSTSSIVQSSSAAITLAPTTSVKMLIIVIKVPENTNINTVGFKANIEDKLYEVYWIGKLIENAKRPKRRSIPDSRVEVKNMQRDGEEVDIRYIVIANNRTMPAKAAAKTMDSISIKRMSEIIEYDVISRPKSVPSIDPKSQVVVILVETISQKNLSNPVTRSSFENELASFYKTSKKVSNVHTVEATLTKLFFEPLGRTYIEYFITVDNITVDRTKVLVAFNVSVNELSNSLKQTVLVAPYIPSVLQLSEMDYIIQTMEFKSVSDLNAIEQEIANKLTQVYIKARLKTSRKRKKRALGSIDAVVTKTKKTQGESADVTYYISDAGSILNATYACAILNKLTIHEMSSVTTPYTVTSTPRPLTPTTSGASDKDDEHPSWFIPVIIAGSLGFLLLIIVIILYCRWKKGAPPKKVQPQANEEEVHKPRMTHASEPEGRSALRHPPSLTTRAAVAVEENGHSETRPKPAPRRLPVRENSVRRKVPSRESVSTRTNPAYVEEESDDETLTDMSVNQSRIQETNVVVGRRTQSETPRKTIPPRPLQRTLPSDEEDESEESEDDSQFTPNGGAFAVADRHSAGTLPPVAVMTGGPRHPEIQPPVRFRPSVHPEPSLPPLDQKPTSLVGRVVEEEGSVQKEMRTKADIERWRNKQRQRDKKLGESSKSGNKRPSFTEKKAWGRAQQEIGAVLDPEAMQPIVRKTRRKPRRKYKIRAETSDDEENVELRGFRKLTSPREEKVPNAEHESPSDSDISMGEARRRMIALIDDAFTSIKSASKKHHPETSDQVDAGGQAQSRPQNKQPPPLYPRPTTLTPALPEPPPSHGRASIPSARHRRRFMNSQNSLPYPSQYYPGMSGGYSPRYPPPPPPPVVTKNPLVVWDPVDKQRALNQSAYRPYARTPYSYTDPSGKLHFTPVQQTPDGMGGLVWSPYATEYAMEDFYRNVEMPGTLDPKNSSFLSKMEETTLGESTSAPRETVVEMPQADIAGEPGTRTGEPAEPLVRAIKDELFRLASGRSPVKHM